MWAADSNIAISGTKRRYLGQGSYGAGNRAIFLKVVDLCLCLIGTAAGVLYRIKQELPMITIFYLHQYDESMRIRWHGHSCFEFIDNENSVLMDPHDGKSIGIKPPISNAGIVVVSHDHFDHNALRVIKNEHSTLFTLKGKHEIKGIEFEGFPSFHDDSQGSIRGSNTIYKFTMDGISICHCGDLGAIPSEEVLAALKNVDIIFVPVGEVYTFPLSAAKEFLRLINPQIIVPMHYRVGGLTIPLKTLEEFLADVPPDNILYVGNEVELTSEDIFEFSGIWVFDR